MPLDQAMQKGTQEQSDTRCANAVDDLPFLSAAQARPQSRESLLKFRPTTLDLPTQPASNALDDRAYNTLHQREKSFMIRLYLRSIVAVLALTFGFVVSAHATNGYTNSLTCACSTTSDFTNAAAGYDAAYDKQNVTYIISSTTTAKTAYVYVTGSIQYVTDPATGWQFPAWVPQSATPVDATGASIGGLNATQQALIYAAIDTGVFGDRNTPMQLNENIPSFPWGSFVCTAGSCMSDSDITTYLNTSIGADWLNNNLADGKIVRVVFRDGSTADFIFHKGQNGQPGTFTWDGDAWDSAGNKINRDGSHVANPSTAGGTGGGYNTLNAFAQDIYADTTLSYILRSLAQCVAEEQVWLTTDPAHPVLLSSGYHWTPCQ
jgi:hypothetical protein